MSFKQIVNICMGLAHIRRTDGALAYFQQSAKNGTRPEAQAYRYSAGGLT